MHRDKDEEVTPSPLREWAGRILELSQRLLDLAKEQQWQQMLAVEHERRSLIDMLFRHPQMPSALVHVADLLEQVIEIDAVSLALGREARSRMSVELDSMTAVGREGVIRLYNSHQH